MISNRKSLSPPPNKWTLLSWNHLNLGTISNHIASTFFPSSNQCKWNHTSSKTFHKVSRHHWTHQSNLGTFFITITDLAYIWHLITINTIKLCVCSEQILKNIEIELEFNSPSKILWPYCFSILSHFIAFILNLCAKPYKTKADLDISKGWISMILEHNSVQICKLAFFRLKFTTEINTSCL